MNKKIKTEIAIGIILLIVIVVGGIIWLRNTNQGQGSNNNRSQNSHCLMLQSGMDKDKLLKEEPLKIKLALKNICSEPIIVNKRIMYFKPEISVELTNEKGTVLRWLPFAPTAPITKDDFDSLDPQKQIAHETQDLRYYLFDKFEPGKYTIVATYKNELGEELGIHAWKGEIKSNLLTFEITR